MSLPWWFSRDPQLAIPLVLIGNVGHMPNNDGEYVQENEDAKKVILDVVNAVAKSPKKVQAPKVMRVVKCANGIISYTDEHTECKHDEVVTSNEVDFIHCTLCGMRAPLDKPTEFGVYKLN